MIGDREVKGCQGLGMGEGPTMKGHEGTLVAMMVIFVKTHSTRC